MTEMGKRDYYAAVEASAQQMMSMQHHHAMEQHAAQQLSVAYAAMAERRVSSINLLLLMP